MSSWDQMILIMCPVKFRILLLFALQIIEVMPHWILIHLKYESHTPDLQAKQETKKLVRPSEGLPVI